MPLQVSGVEGNFRRTCEAVMGVIRGNKDSVMAMLEAFVHDPLINWRLMQLSPKEPPGKSAAGGGGGADAEGGAEGGAGAISADLDAISADLDGLDLTAEELAEAAALQARWGTRAASTPPRCHVTLM